MNNASGWLLEALITSSHRAKVFPFVAHSGAVLKGLGPWFGQATAVGKAGA